MLGCRRRRGLLLLLLLVLALRLLRQLWWWCWRRRRRLLLVLARGRRLLRVGLQFPQAGARRYGEFGVLVAAFPEDDRDETSRERWRGLEASVRAYLPASDSVGGRAEGRACLRPGCVAA